MKKIIIYISIILIIFSYGCKKFLDVNHDPDVPENSTVQLVFPAAVVGGTGVLGSYVLMLGEIWSQHWTAINFYHEEETYSVPAGKYSYDIGTWNSLYAGSLMDYEWVKNTAEADSNWTYYFMATAMQCYTFQVLADLFEDIPISEALKGGDANFDFDSSVYVILINRLNYILTLDLEAPSCEEPGEDDLIFGGDMDKWVAFVNTLKLKIYLRESLARPDIAEKGITDMIDNNVPFLDEDVVFSAFADEISNDNFMYAMEFRGGNISMRASKTLLDFLDDIGDDRLNFIYIKDKKSSVHSAMYQGDYLNTYTNFDAENPKLSRPRITATMPFYYFSKAQINLMLAEADVRYYGGTNAETYYNNALEADASRLNTLFADSISFFSDTTYFDPITLANLQSAYPYPASGNDEENIEAIIVQKWICCANIMGFESYFEHNRTGYPREYDIPLSSDDFDDGDALGKFIMAPNSVLSPPILFPKRLLYSSSERNRNPLAPQEVKSINEPIWWDYQYSN